MLRLVWSWFEFLVVYVLIVVGFIYGIKYDKIYRDILLMILLLVIMLNGVNGFIFNGLFECYIFGLLVLMSIFFGYGIIEFYNNFKLKIKFLNILIVEKWIVLFLIV